MTTRWILSALVLLTLTVALAGCGSGSSSLATPVAPTVSAAAAVNAPDGAPGNSDVKGPPNDWAAHPPIHVRKAALASPVGYTPTQIRHAYGFDALTGNTGAGQTIAIVDAYGNPSMQADLNTFSAKFGLPNATVTTVYPAGKPKQVNGGWALETALDVEWAHAVAPGAAILLVVSPDASMSKLLACVDYASARAAQVSMSWGGAEFSGQTGVNYDGHFNKANVSFTASSGDSGGGPIWPSSCPYVVCVGGTTLSLDAAGNVTKESAWAGSNGGPSAWETEPAYQQAWQTTGKRQMPDVSYNADPASGVPVYLGTKYNGKTGWYQVGGTSAGAPQWAGLFALVNAARTGAKLSSPNVGLYSLGSPTSLATYFRDITSGANKGFTAVAGFDMVTGVGSPLGAALVPALVTK